MTEIGLSVINHLLVLGMPEPSICRQRYAEALYMPAKMQQKELNLIPIQNQLIRDGKNAKIHATGTQVQLRVYNQVHEGVM